MGNLVQPLLLVDMKDSALLEHIVRQPHGKTSLKHLFRELRVKGDDRASIEAAVDRLTGRGELIQLPNQHYVAASKSREFVAGRVSIHRDGYGFLVPDRPIPGVQGDLYIGRDNTRGAMNGDRAIGRITHSGPQWPLRRRDRQGAQARASHCGGPVPHQSPRDVRRASR